MSNIFKYIKNNSAIIVMFLIIIFGGIYGNPIIGYTLCVLFSLYCYKMEEVANYFAAILIIFILSDSRVREFEWLKNIKLFMLLFSYYWAYRTYELDNKPNKIFLTLIATFIISLFTIVQLPNAFIGLQRTISWGACYLIIPIVFSKIYNNFKTEFIYNLIYALFLFLIVSIVLFYLNNASVTLAGRYKGLMGNPNAIAFTSALAIILIHIVKKDVIQINQTEYWILISPALVSIYLSQSRNAIFCLIIYFTFNKIANFSNVLAVVIAIASAFVYDLINTNLIYLVTKFNLESYFRLETLQSGSGRLVAWQFALNHVNDNFWFGGGITYTDYLYEKHEFELNMLGHQGNAHNSYLTLWLDFGLIGMLIFIRGYLISFLNLIVINKKAIAVLCVILFSAFFESWLTAVLSPNVFIILLIYGALQIETLENKNIESGITTQSVEVIAQPNF